MVLNLFLLHGPLEVKKNFTDLLIFKVYYWWTPEYLKRRFKRVQYFTVVVFTDPQFRTNELESSEIKVGFHNQTDLNEVCLQ